VNLLGQVKRSLQFNAETVTGPLYTPRPDLASQQHYLRHIVTVQPKETRQNRPTMGVQIVRSLIQLTTEYEHDILSLFNPSTEMHLGLIQRFSKARIPL